MLSAMTCYPLLPLIVLSHPFVHAAIIQRAQLTFPPTNGPCRQNAGLVPLQCSDTACLDIPASGVCNIQTQDGFPICGCCDSTITLACSACGGEAGGGICKGTGTTGIAYQGCPCSIAGGDVPNDDQFKVCPEDQGKDTQMCSAPICGGDSLHTGICDSRVDVGSGMYRFCACCPDGQNLGCKNCGGDNGSGKCRGVELYTGIQYLNCTCTADGTGGTIPIIVPFPIPPPGFPPVPPGTPHPKTPCSETIDVKCSDCNGKSGWCQEGDSAGCPCHEDQCPDGLNVPDCSDAICGGATDTLIISTCKGDPNGKNRGCGCFQYKEDPPPYEPFSVQELNDHQAFIGQIISMANSPTSASSATPMLPTATAVLTCSGNSVASVPSEMIETTGNVTPNQLLYTLRQVLCTNACDQPAGLPNGVAWSTGSKTTGDCEVSVSIVGGIEAYMYRGTASTGDQWQQCWDSTQNIIEKCVAEGPNTGWVNGPAPYQFYQGGFRPLNDKGAIHRPMFGNSLQATVATGAVSPQNAQGFTCGSGTGGSRLVDCLNILGSILSNGKQLSTTDTTESICTDDSTCLQSGNTGSADEKSIYSSYCKVAASGGCAFVIASKAKFLGGFPGRSCISPADMSNFIRLGANQCGANQASGVWAAGFKAGDVVAGWPFTALGLVDSSNPGVLYVP